MKDFIMRLIRWLPPLHPTNTKQAKKWDKILNYTLIVIVITLGYLQGTLHLLPDLYYTLIVIVIAFGYIYYMVKK